MFKKKITNFLAAAVIAWGYGALTYLIFFFVTSKNPLISTILNALAIILIVIWEKIENYYAKPEPESKVKTTKASVSVKSGLYLFYVVYLICTALLAAEPDLPFLSNFNDYFPSVSSGLLILIAVDKFIEQLTKDMAK